jgi:serine/threonine-protein kinase
MGQTMTVESSVVLGSVSYLSPEQVQRGVADARSDIYAVGIVLFEMLTGSKPYSGETPIQIAYRHVNDRIPNIQTVRSEIPASLAEIVYETTAPNPDHRPSNAEELLNKLKEIQAQIDPKRRQMSLELDLPPIAIKKSKRGKVSVTSAFDGLKEKTSQLMSSKPINVSKPEDSIRTKKRKVSRRVRRNRIIALFLLVLIIFGGYRLSNAGKIPVPSLVGMSQSEAKRNLDGLGLNIEVVEEVFSEDVAKGKIIATKPGGGGKISPAGTVGLVVSKGKERIVVPALQGMTPDVASGKIADLGLNVGQISEMFDLKIATGYVISSDPAEGSEVKSKSIINLIVSKGIEQLSLSSYVGKGGEQALSELNNLGFDVDVKYSFSDKVFKGQVITQTPEKSDLIGKGSKIALVISKGPEFVFVPNVLGKNKNDASVDLENLGLKVSAKGSGKVNNIAPAVGSKVKQGTVVTITLR